MQKDVPAGMLDDFYSRKGRTGVLLLHGFTGSPASMRPWAEDLASSGYTVRLPRLPGHGSRWQELNKVPWQEWTKKAEEELRELRKECDRVFIFGLSMGGANALYITAQNQELVAGVVLVNPMIHIVDPAIRLIWLTKHLVSKRPSIGDDIKKAGVTEWGYDALPTKGVAQLHKFLKVTYRLLDKINVPVLLFHSSDDHVLPLSNSKIIYERIQSKDKQWIELTNSYHVATIDFDAELIFRNSQKFIEMRS
jgi:carboxylesterase